MKGTKSGTATSAKCLFWFLLISLKPVGSRRSHTMVDPLAEFSHDHAHQVVFLGFSRTKSGRSITAFLLEFLFLCSRQAVVDEDVAPGHSFHELVTRTALPWFSMIHPRLHLAVQPLRYQVSRSRDNQSYAL
jgi:hypothetical protein